MDQTRLSKYTAVHITLILGPPACGKGTLSTRFATKQNSYHLSVGDYLRSLCAETHPETAPAFGEMNKTTLKAALTAHKLVPAEKIVAMVWHKIGVEIDNGWSKFLIDGFPRDEKAAWQFEQKLQVSWFPFCLLFLSSARSRAALTKESVLADPSLFPSLPLSISCLRSLKARLSQQQHAAEDIKTVISIDCPKAICKERFLKRRRESTDSGEVFEKRYKEFQD